MKWAGALLVVLALAGCKEADRTITTVTVTQSATSATEDPMCDDIRVQRDLNKTLAERPEVDDYSATYDQMLESLGCRP